MFRVQISGVKVTLGALYDAYGSFGAVHLYGTKGDLAVKLTDTYHAFRGQLVAFIDMLRTGKRPLPFDETVELMAVIIAGIRSREQGAARWFRFRRCWRRFEGWRMAKYRNHPAACNDGDQTPRWGLPNTIVFSDLTARHLVCL